MPDIWMNVDAAVTVPVNKVALTDDTDFKTRETAVAYNAAGMDLVWNFVDSAGTITQTAVTPTTAGDYDWTHVGDGMYKIEIPASGGASINNTAEGYGWFSGIVTGVLPFSGPIVGFRAAALNDALCDGGDLLDVNMTQIAGSSVNTSSAQLGVNIVNAAGTAWGSGAITPGSIASNAITSTKIAASAIGASQIATGAITAAKFAASAITSTVIADAAITAAKINAAALNGKGDWNVGKTGYTLTQSFPANFAAMGISAAGNVDADMRRISTSENAADWLEANLVADGITVKTNSDKTGYSLATAPPTAAENRAEMDSNSTQLAAIVGDTNELQTDWANGGRLDLILDAVLAMLDDPRGEPGTGAPPVSADLATKVDYLYKRFRNKKDQDGTTWQLYADDGTTVDQQATISEAAGTTTFGEVASG